MNDSIFTKILKGEIPGEKIYEDELAFVILSIEPINPGHMLVIPKQQVDALWDTDDSTYDHLLRVTKHMAKTLDKAYDYRRIGMIVEGFGVPHAHIHVFGYEEPLEPTMVRQAASKQPASPEALGEAGTKLRAAL